MKTLEKIEKQLMKDLEEIGCLDFVIVLSDPDSHTYFRQIGLNLHWQRGVLKTIDEDMAAIIHSNHNEETES